MREHVYKRVVHTARTTRPQPKLTSESDVSQSHWRRIKGRESVRNRRVPRIVQEEELVCLKGEARGRTASCQESRDTQQLRVELNEYYSRILYMVNTVLAGRGCSGSRCLTNQSHPESTED